MVAQICTRRLVLNRLTAADAQPITTALNDFTVTRWLSVVPHPYQVQDAHDYLADAQAQDRTWAMRLNGSLVGIITVNNQLGYWLARAHCGKGYATRAMRGFLGWCDDKFTPNTIIADHFDDNPASGAVLRKLGFIKTGNDMANSSARLEPAPVTLYRMDRNKLKAVK